MRRPDFTSGQREALTKLRVTPEQISRLSGVLLECKRMIDAESKASKPPRQDVSDVLKPALDCNRESSKAMVRVLRANSPASEEALTRTERESFKLNGDGKEIESALQALAFASAVLKRALAGLPKDAVRHRTAFWGPVHLIHQALSDDGIFKPSSGSTSPFRDVVVICYSAIHGKDGVDPERAVKSYCRWLRTQRP